MKTKYVIERHGANRANQPGEQVVILGIVEARNYAEAKTIAEEELGTVYNNQFLRAIPESRVTASKWNYATEEDAINRAEREAITKE